MPAEPELNAWTVALSLLVLTFLAGCLASWSWLIGQLLRRRPLMEAERPRLVPWGAGSVAAVVGLYLALQVGAMLAFASIRGRPEPPVLAPAGGEVADQAEDEESARIDPADQLALVTLTNFGVAMLVPVLLRSTSGARMADFVGESPATIGRDVRRGVVAFFLLTPVTFAIQSVAIKVWKNNDHPVFEVVREDMVGPSTWLAVIAAVIAAPLAEELLFRGVLLGWLTRLAVAGGEAPNLAALPSDIADAEAEPARSIRETLTSPEPEFGPEPPAPKAPPRGPAGLGPAAWMVNGIVSALFASLHIAQWPAPVPLFVLSMGLGWLYQRTGRLVAPVALHMIFNGLSTAVLLLAVAGNVKLPGDEDQPDAPPPVPPPAAVEAKPEPDEPPASFPDKAEVGS